MTGPGVFVFTEDGVRFFASAESAAARIRAAELHEGHYDSFIGLDGERFTPRAVGRNRFDLEGTGERDLVALAALLTHYRDRAGFAADPRDPAAVAAELRAQANASRWPIKILRRPRAVGRHRAGTALRRTRG